MNCALHPDREATAYCRSCGRALCPEDQRDIYGVIYCQNCLAPGVAAAGADAGVPGAPRPALALLLGFIPGVGAIYNGQYLKAFVQVVIFGFLIALVNGANGFLSPLAGIAVAAFYFYMVIDSYHTAKRLEAGLPAPDVLNLGAEQINAPIAAIVLIAIGVLFLLRSLGFFFYDFSRFLWPILLIAVGVYLLRRDRAQRALAPPMPPPPPHVPPAVVEPPASNSTSASE